MVSQVVKYCSETVFHHIIHIAYPLIIVQQLALGQQLVILPDFLFKRLGISEILLFISEILELVVSLKLKGD